MKDNVKCCKCGQRALVPLGDDQCPHCKQEGYLAWVEREPQEVPDYYEAPREPVTR